VIKKILIGMGIAFAILFLLVVGLLIDINMRRFEPDGEIVAKSQSPNGSIQLTVVRTDLIYAKDQVPSSRYYLVFETPNRVFPQRYRYFYGTVIKRADCKDSLSVQWKDNLSLEFQHLANRDGEIQNQTVHLFDDIEIQMNQAPRIRAANCP